MRPKNKIRETSSSRLGQLRHSTVFSTSSYAHLHRRKYDSKLKLKSTEHFKAKSFILSFILTPSTCLRQIGLHGQNMLGEVQFLSRPGEPLDGRFNSVPMV